jgi:hypothetical protein
MDVTLAVGARKLTVRRSSDAPTRSARLLGGFPHFEMGVNASSNGPALEGRPFLQICRLSEDFSGTYAPQQLHELKLQK